MERIRCACLIIIEKDKLLLVRVQDNLKWYLPGGKIEEGETAEQTLVRETAEELNIQLLPESIRYLTTIIGPAYNQNAEVELICFSADWKGSISPNAEISEVAFFDYSEKHHFAPAICLFFEKWLNPYLASTSSR